MRILIKVEMPVEQGNALAKNGTLGTTIQSILDEQKPEAAYFTALNGARSGLIIVNMKDTSEIPAYAEPWFLALNAKVEFHPAMTPEDLAKAGPSIGRAVKKYGRESVGAAVGAGLQHQRSRSRSSVGVNRR